jgi:hypothetical protein
MGFNGDYLYKILNNSWTAKKLVESNSFPVRRLEIELIPMDDQSKTKYISFLGKDQFEQFYNEISNFPTDFIELNSKNFYTPKNIIDRKSPGMDLGFSKRQSSLILNLAEDVEKVRSFVSYDEFFNSIKNFFLREYPNVENFQGLTLPGYVGVVEKKYLDKKVVLGFESVHYSKNY